VTDFVVCTIGPHPVGVEALPGERYAVFIPPGQPTMIVTPNGHQYHPAEPGYTTVVVYL
jgi:hypothetical protein